MKRAKLALQFKSENEFEENARECRQMKSAKRFVGYVSYSMEAFQYDIRPNIEISTVGEIKLLVLMNVLRKIEKAGV